MLQIRNQLGVELDAALEVLLAQRERLPVDEVVGLGTLPRLDNVIRLEEGRLV